MCRFTRGLPLALIAFGTILGCNSASAQAPAVATTRDPLQQTLIVAAHSFGLSTKDAGPFHLKAHFETFNAEGNPDGSGTLEEYWDGKERLRRELVYRGATMTTWQTPTKFRKGQIFRSSYFMRQLVAGFESAIPSAQSLERRTFTDKQETLGSVPMHCILARSKPSPLQSELPPNTAFGPIDEEAYCLSDADRFLRLKQWFPEVVLVYNKLHPFGTKAVPYDILLTQGKLVHGRFQVDTLETWTPEDAVFVPTTDAQEDTQSAGPAVGVTGGVIAGNIISKRNPEYPPFAKATHLQGSVVLAALITKQGTIEDLEVLASPGPSLSEAAKEAVKQWRYKPYLLNGLPTEVDTTITVNFAFGPG
jgi:TonB family protein